MSSTPRAMPLYTQVKQRISDAIMTGHWLPGQVIPGEAQLAAEYGIAVGTVRRALGDLVAEGQLSRQPKRGTVVTGRPPLHSLRFFYQYFRLHGRDGAVLTSTVRPLSLERAPADAADAARLGLAAGTPLIVLHRLRYVAGQPVMTDRFRFAAARAPNFPDSLAAAPELLYRFLLDECGIRLSAAREAVGAVLAEAADCAALGLEPPAALLAIEAVAFDQAGQPSVLATHRARTDDYAYLNEVR